MRFKINVIALRMSTLALAAGCSLACQAQAVNGPGRAQVVADFLAAKAAGLLIPAGEGQSKDPKVAPSMLARATVEAETKQSAAMGSVSLSDVAADHLVDRQFANTIAIRSRAEVGAETLSAAKAHLLIPAGENIRVAGY